MGLMGHIRAALRCARGTAAVEAALIFPILVSTLLGMVELAQFVEANRKAVSAAQSVADLVAQYKTHDDTSIAGVRQAANLILDPLRSASGNADIIIASIGYDDDGSSTMLWQHNPDGSLNITLDPTVADGLGSPGESVIMVRLSYTYDSLFDFIFDTKPLQEEAFARPRLARRIALNGDADHQS